MSNSDPDDRTAEPSLGRRVLGRAMVRAVQVLAELMDHPDKLVAYRAAVEVMRLSTACMRHGAGLPLDWADDSPEGEPVPVAPEPEPVLDLPAGVEADATPDEWAEFSRFAREMGFDEGAIDLARRSIGVPDPPAADPRPRPGVRRHDRPARSARSRVLSSDRAGKTLTKPPRDLVESPCPASPVSWVPP